MSELEGFVFTKEYVDCGGGVRRCDTWTIMSGLVVRYYLDAREHAEMSASRDGVLISNVMVHNEGKERFETILKWCFRHHDSIRAGYGRGFQSKPEPIPQESLGRIDEVTRETCGEE